MPYANNLREEEIKNKLSSDYFSSYDSTQIIGNIDFCIAKIVDKSEGRQGNLFEESVITQSFLWAEAKRGYKHDIYESFVQLILTIGKARTFEKYLPPVFLGHLMRKKLHLFNMASYQMYLFKMTLTGQLPHQITSQKNLSNYIQR